MASNHLNLRGINRFGLNNQTLYQHPGPFLYGVLSVTDYFRAGLRHRPLCNFQGMTPRVTAPIPIMFNGIAAYAFETTCATCISQEIHGQVVILRANSPFMAHIHPIHPGYNQNWSGRDEEGPGPSDPMYCTCKNHGDAKKLTIENVKSIIMCCEIVIRAGV